MNEQKRVDVDWSSIPKIKREHLGKHECGSNCPGCAGEKKIELKGALIFYVDIGQLPPQKVDAHVEKVKEGMKELIEGSKPHWVSVFVPTRGQSSHIEQLKL